jgi:hypothetical protein
MSDALINLLTNRNVQDFVFQCGHLPPAQWLNLAQKEFGSNARFVLEYLQLRLKARAKVPDLAEKWLFSTKSFEQCTSELVARFKAERFKPQDYTDLTAGAGVDAWFMGMGTNAICLVEHDPGHAAFLRHNFAGTGAQVVEGDAASLLHSLPGGDVVYIDPDRRPAGQRVYGFEEARPNVIELLPSLKAKFKRVIIKASPMADVHQCLRQLVDVTRVLAIVAQGELKEVLFEVSDRLDDGMLLEAVWLYPDGQVHRFFGQIRDERCPPMAMPVSGQWFFEPHAGLIKLRLGKAHAATLGLMAIQPNADYFLGKERIDDYPGRQWCIVAVWPYKPKQLKQQLQAMGIYKAHLSKRDFFLEIAELRKILQLPEGEDAHLFFTKNKQGQPICVICESR